MTDPAMHNNSRIKGKLFLASQIAAALGALIGLLTLIGWQFNISFLIRPIPGLVAMNPLTAACFLLCGIIYYYLFGKKRSLRFAGILSVLLFALAFTDFLCFFFPEGFQIDSILYHSKIVDVNGALSNKMALNTALNFILFAIAFFFLRRQDLRSKWVADILCAIAGLFAYFACLGYLYRVSEFYASLRYFPMSIHTGLAFLLLSITLLCAEPSRGLNAVFTRTAPGTRLGLNVALVVVFLPALLGFFRLLGQWNSLFSVELGTLFLIMAITIILFISIWYNTAQLRQREETLINATAVAEQFEQQFNLVADNIFHSAFILLDTDGNIRSWNKAATALFGYAADEIIGQPLSKLYGRENDAELTVKSNLRRALTDGNFRVEGWRYKKDGRRIWGNVLYSLLRDTAGRPTGFIKIVNDSSERQELIEQLKTFNRDLEAEVAAKTKEYIDMVDRITVGFIALDKDFRYTFANRAIGEMTQRDPRTLIGKHIWDEFPDARDSQTRIDFETAFREQRYINNTDYHPSTDFYQENYIYPSKEGLSIFIRDITSERKAQISAEEMEQRSQAIMQSVQDAVVVFDEKDSIRFWNPQAEVIFGWKAEEVIGQKLVDLRLWMPPASDPGIPVRSLKERVEKMVGSAVSEFVGIRKDGSSFPAEVSMTSFIQHEEKLYCGFVRDITERRNAEISLNESRNQLRALSSHLQDIREEERVRIAREIHDVLGQQLTVIKMDTGWLKRHLKESPQPVQERLAELSEMLDESVKTVRKIASDLRPSILDDLGLVTTIEWQLKEFEKRTGISTSFKMTGNDIEWSDAVRTGLFRMFQETLTNVARHAEATEVAVFLDIFEEEAVLTVRDNGKGFDIEKIKAKRTLGLLGMEERVLMLGGRRSIQSSVNNGTTVALHVPLKANQ